ncbi:hypothetical protein [Thiohalorhabdus denitrificans]|uniref:Cofactor-independent phosphoglycerate mutase n=1 Tax=Thiohalorhabdus denitrificans TaxID=381306 RepID=A0A1G5H0Q1_9GAMM|nr:hypothetical protein [Thiohalorhabdus denitrificans]SCY57314.1 hypothetical protein SAMN05661077_2558 [Thiohalorhabdus denitrificans]
MNRFPKPALVLLIRGAADHPQDLLGGRTPLEYGDLPNLRRLARRGRPRAFDAAPSGHSVHAGGDLLAAFGRIPAPEEDPPAGVVDWLGAGRDPEGGVYLHADPARLAVTPEAAVVLDPDELALDREEAEELANALNRELFAEQGGHLSVLEPGRWVLHLPEAPGIRTVPLEAWIGADARGGLPGGEEEVAWHRLANEVQMVLAAHPVNERRRRAGRPEANTLWFWGSGALPEPGSPGPWKGVWGEAPLLPGLARLSGVAHQGPLPDLGPALSEAQGGGPVLAVADQARAAGARGDLGAKLEALEELDRRWLGPLEEALARRDLGSAWVVLGPEAPTGARAAEPPPSAPALSCHAGKVWPWSRARTVSENRLSGAPVGWEAVIG